MKKLTGGCLCGAVHYETTADAVMAGNCHCRDCQKASGSAYAPTLFVPQSDLKVVGEVKYYTSKGDSGKEVRRGFCPVCGSQLLGTIEVIPHLVAIRAGTLDQPKEFIPHLDLYTSSANYWDFMDPKLPKFEKSPPMR